MADVLRVAISAVDARNTALDSPDLARGIGALLLRLLTGEAVQPQNQRCDGDLPLPDLAKARPGIPDDLASLVYELLDPDPALRLSDLKEVRARLSHLMTLVVESRPRKQPLPGDGGSSPIPQPASCFALTGGTTVPFVGRRQELARLVALLTDGPERLITVTGPGGVGKSRLAMEAASRLQSSFRDGVRSIALVTLARPAFLGFAVARGLDISLGISGDPTLQVLEFLRHRHLLLLLDDIDHLRGGLDWFAGILEQAPEVRILATSRERLGVSFERVIELEGLPSPVGAQRDEFDRSEAVQLFLENVSRIHPGFALRQVDMPFIAEICRMLGGLPLALELASRRIRIMSCEQIAAEISSDLDLLHTEEAGVPERHRSMRAVFDRSWDGLSEEERRALRALALCTGSCPWDIAAAGIDAGHSMLESLAAKGLVHQPTPGRIKLHPIITHYAEGKLAGIRDEAQEVRRRFARVYGRLAAEWEPGLKGGPQRETLEAFDSAMPNMSQSFLWAAEMRNEDLLDQYVPGLSLYYLARGRFHDAEETFRTAVQMAGAQEPPIPGEGGPRLAALLQAHHGRFLFRIGRFEEAEAALNVSLHRFREDRDRRAQAMALGELGHVARLTGRYEEAEARHHEALELERGAGTTWGIARCLQDLGNVACAQGRYTEAVRFHRESLALSRQLDDQIGAASCMNNLANALDSLGRAVEARHYYEQGVAATQALGDTQLYALALANFGNIAYKQGDYAAAIPALRESLTLERKTGSLEGQAFCLSVLGDIALAQKRELEARDLLEQSLAISRQTGDQSGTAYILNSLGSVALALGDTSEAVERCSESVGIFEDIGEQWGLALALQGLADAELARSNPTEALAALRRAMELSAGLEADPLTADILLTWAAWFRAQGNAARAIELAARAATHESTEVQTRDRAAVILAALRAELPPEAYDAACAGGEHAALETLIGALLDQV